MFFTSLIDLFLRRPENNEPSDNKGGIATAIVYLVYFSIMLFLAISVI